MAGSGEPDRAADDRGTASGRPNIVFVLTDDLSWNLVRHMPRVRALQRRGTTFTRYFVVNSLCCPSRAAILTGAYPHNNGIYSNVGIDGGFLGFRNRGLEQATFATALRSAGYRTALMGKYFNGYPAASRYEPPGWTDWVGSDRVYTGYDYYLNDNRSLVHHGARPGDYVTDVLARRGAAFIDEVADEGGPFLLELATYAPHKPYTPAPRHARAFPRLRAPRGPAFDRANENAPAWLQRRPRTPREVKRFDAIFRDRVRSVQAVDELIGRIQARVRARGLEDNTYIVFGSDNGYHLGEHRLMPGKMTAFDTDIRVPLIVAGPRVPAGRTVDHITQSIDLNATFAQLARTRPSRMSDGRSLVPLLHGGRVVRWRQAALVEHRGADWQPDDPDYPGMGASTPPTYEAMRTPYGLYVEYLNGEREYYDTRRDPGQVRNLYPFLGIARRVRLAARLEGLRRCRGASRCWAAATPR